MNQQTVDYGIYDDSTSMRLLQVGKVTISAISSDPLCNDGIAGFKIVLLKPICLIYNVKDIAEEIPKSLL